ncbi:MAG: helix-turn-helix domain-containing protein [Candidatus Diapherotrites archaeon]
MWVAKLKYTHEDSATIPYAKKYNITILAYPMNSYEKDGMLHITTGHLIKGEKEDKEKYFKEIVKNKKLEQVEIEGDFVIYSLSVPAKETHMQIYITPEIILTKPIEIRPDGFQYTEFASWDKKYLTGFIKKAGKYINIELSKIMQEKITDFYIPHAMPKLTEKQKKTVLTAYKNGYYEYPKKTTIESLARQLKLGASTAQEHLRKAEQKLLPYLLENIVKE